MDMNNVGRRIKDARIRKGLTQFELSQSLSLTPKYVSNIECGAKNPRLETFIAIANTLEVDANSLLVDVLGVSEQIHCSDLWQKISGLSPEKRQKLLRIMELMIEVL